MNPNQRRAARIADQVLAELNFRSGETERQVADRIAAALRRRGARPSFQTIVASGPRTVQPHARPTKRRLRDGELLKIDLGARYRGWCSDITRTFFLGRPTARFRRVYRAVKLAQARAIKQVRAGVVCSAIDRAARQYLKTRGFSRYFIHSTGHGIGRKVHQRPRISLKSEERLRAGEVITVEPGVYIKGWGGVRIEDMVLVTRRGGQLLTRAKK